MKCDFDRKVTRPAVLLWYNAGRANRRDVTQEAAYGLLYVKQGTGAGDDEPHQRPGLQLQSGNPRRSVPDLRSASPNYSSGSAKVIG